MGDCSNRRPAVPCLGTHPGSHAAGGQLAGGDASPGGCEGRTLLALGCHVSSCICISTEERSKQHCAGFHPLMVFDSLDDFASRHFKMKGTF